MTIYEHTTSLTTASGSVSSASLNIRGGLLRHVLVRANTATTVFRVNLFNEDNITMLNYGYHTGEINDASITMPVQGVYTLQVTNASPNDTFRIYMGVEE